MKRFNLPWRPLPLGEEGDQNRLAKIQFLRKISLAVLVLIGLPLCAFTRSLHEATGDAHIAIQSIGVVALIVCILGRTWTSLYIAGRKTELLVTDGPYSVMRNPLYFFSIVGAVGAGAQFGSVLCGVFFGLVVWVIFYRVILHEERVLFRRYGLAFASYVATVPRLIPRPKLWRDPPVLTIVPRLILRTFFDATLFLLAIPTAEIFEVLQDSGVLKIWCYLI